MLLLFNNKHSCINAYHVHAALNFFHGKIDPKRQNPYVNIRLGCRLRTCASLCMHACMFRVEKLPF